MAFYSPAPSRPRSFYRSLTDVASLTPQEFEEYISFLLQELGYRTVRRGAVGDADGGVDIDAWKDGRHVLVQCKRYDSSWVHHGHVRDLVGAVVLESAAAGFLVTTGRITDAAFKAAARVGNIVLVGPGDIKVWQKLAGVGPYLRLDIVSKTSPASLKDDHALVFNVPDSFGQQSKGFGKVLALIALVLVCVMVWCSMFGLVTLRQRVFPTATRSVDVQPTLEVYPTATFLSESFYTPQPLKITVTPIVVYTSTLPILDYDEKGNLIEVYPTATSAVLR